MLDIKTKRVAIQFAKGLVGITMIIIVAVSGFFALSAASQLFFGYPFYWMLPAALIFIGYMIWDWATFRVEMQIRDEEHLVNTLSKKHEP